MPRCHQSTPLLSVIPPWSADCVSRYETRLARITAYAGFALSWLDNPEWCAFVDEFIPGAPQVSRRVITRCVLPNVVRDLDTQVTQSINGKEAVMQADGWTGLNHSHLIAIMISCDQAVYPFYHLTWTYIISQLYTLEVHDASRERKTAENLLRLFYAAYN